MIKALGGLFQGLELLHIVSEEDLGMMLFGILPQEFHSGKIALLIIDHAGKLRHRLIVARE